jgi:hypothetical protein
MGCGQSRVLLAAIFTLACTAFARPVHADPASTLQTLMIVDQGDFISFQWSFYFVDFPPRFVLKENPSETVVLDNPATLEENVSKLVAVAFDLKINGQHVRPDKISRLDISPNKVCTVTMIYRGRPGGKVELRAPVLGYLPATALINYEIVSLGHTTDVVTGNLIGHQGPFPQMIQYRQVLVGIPTMPETKSSFSIYFKTGLRTAWINLSWLFISLVLFLVLKPFRAILCLIIMMAGYFVLGLLNAGNIKLHWTIPDLMPGLLTALLGVVGVRLSAKEFLLIFIACGTGCRNAVHDLQPLQLSAEDHLSSALMGLVSGFACGLLSIAVVLALIVGECKKYPKFKTDWAPKICWAVGAFSLIFSLQKTLFP